MTLTSPEYWRAIWEKDPPHGFLYIDEVLPFLPKAPRSFLEIGCAPGGILADFCTRMGYEAHGVDWAADPSVIRAFLESKQVKVGAIHQADIFTWQPPQQYDIVSSFGFIEHFDDPDVVADRHFQFVRPGGLVVIGVPNFARGQKVLHLLFDREQLSKHNTQCMSLSFLHAAGARHGARLLYSGYTGGHFAFWYGEEQRSRITRALMHRTIALGQAMARRVPGKTNPLFSPYLLAVFEAR